jgi:hypothetical protein
MIKTIVKLIFFSFALLAGGCDRNYDGEAADLPKVGAAPHPDTQVTDIPTEWESFKRETELQIDANQAKLRELRNTASAKHAQKIAELDEKNEMLRRELREYNYDNEERWITFRDGFSQNMFELGQEIDGVYTVKGK